MMLCSTIQASGSLFIIVVILLFKSIRYFVFRVFLILNNSLPYSYIFRLIWKFINAHQCPVEWCIQYIQADADMAKCKSKLFLITFSGRTLLVHHFLNSSFSLFRFPICHFFSSSVQSVIFVGVCIVCVCARICVNDFLFGIVVSHRHVDHLIIHPARCCLRYIQGFWNIITNVSPFSYLLQKLCTRKKK